MKFTADDFVVVIFAFVGFLGSVILFKLAVPPIIVSMFLATGVAALVYRFLGGISGASFGVGALKLTGTIAVLIGVALIINTELEKQLNLHLLTDADMVGQWRWVYGKGGWTGILNFSEDRGKLRFDGQEDKCIDGVCHSLYDLINGTANVTGQGNVDLETDVHDRKWNLNYHFKTAVPLQPVLALRGNLRRRGDNDPNDVWGMTLYKWPAAE